LSLLCQSKNQRVSIPDRDYRGFRLNEINRRIRDVGLFQSLIGIIEDFDPTRASNPPRFRQFQSLIGIIEDFDLKSGKPQIKKVKGFQSLIGIIEDFDYRQGLIVPWGARFQSLIGIIEDFDF